MVFHWSLSDSKSPQVSRTLLSILAVLSNNFIWIVTTHPPTSNSSRPFNNPLVIVPKHQSQLVQSSFSYYHYYYYYYYYYYYDYYYYYYYYLLIKVFHISISWWFFTGVWVTASLLKSPGLFSVFWPFSVMMSFGESLPFRQLPSPPGFVIILSLLSQKNQTQLVQSSLSYYYYYYY